MDVQSLDQSPGIRDRPTQQCQPVAVEPKPAVAGATLAAEPRKPAVVVEPRKPVAVEPKPAVAGATLAAEPRKPAVVVEPRKPAVAVEPKPAAVAEPRKPVAAEPKPVAEQRKTEEIEKQGERPLSHSEVITQVFSAMSKPTKAKTPAAALTEKQGQAEYLMKEYQPLLKKGRLRITITDSGVKEVEEHAAVGFDVSASPGQAGQAGQAPGPRQSGVMSG
jgi:hypothetical protein